MPLGSRLSAPDLKCVVMRTRFSAASVALFCLLAGCTGTSESAMTNSSSASRPICSVRRYSERQLSNSLKRRAHNTKRTRSTVRLFASCCYWFVARQFASATHITTRVAAHVELPAGGAPRNSCPRSRSVYRPRGVLVARVEREARWPTMIGA